MLFLIKNNDKSYLCSINSMNEIIVSFLNLNIKYYRTIKIFINSVQYLFNEVFNMYREFSALIFI